MSNNSDDFWTTRAVDLELNTSNYTLLKYKYAFLVVFDKMFMTVENSIFQLVVSYVPYSVISYININNKFSGFRQSGSFSFNLGSRFLDF